MIAASNPAASTVRLLPGDYLDNIIVSTGSILIVGTGARIDARLAGADGVLNVLRGADITIRGLHLDLAHGRMFCGGGAGPTELGGTLTLRDLTIDTRDPYMFDMYGCTAILRRVEFVGGGGSFILRDYSSLDGDRIRFSNVSYPLLMGLATILTIKNSVFENTMLVLDPQDTGANVSTVVFAHNTVYTTGSIALYRQVTATNLSARIENNIIVSASPNAISASQCPAPDCVLANNVVFPQAMALPASNIVMDPKLVNAAMGDYHLRSDSPAVGAAVPTGPGATDHDFAGVARPQGSAPDIGAFELVP